MLVACSMCNAMHRVADSPEAALWRCRGCLFVNMIGTRSFVAAELVQDEGGSTDD